MNVLAPHTTAIHKQDVKTQLEVLNAGVEMALLEMESDAVVCPHNIMYHIPVLCIRHFPTHYSDINECARSTNNCHPQARCENTIGSFKCKCRDGFAGNGVRCSGMSSQHYVSHTGIVYQTFSHSLFRYQ